MNKLLLIALTLITGIVSGPDVIAAQDNDLKYHNFTLKEIITQRPEQDRTRDAYRRPQQTLDFFAIKPDMTVAEVLPGGGWYTRILALYLSQQGTLHGLNYADEMWPMFGFFNTATIAKRKQATIEFPSKVGGWGGNGNTSQGFAFNKIPEDITGSVDAVLMIRALHNLNRFESKAGTRSKALANVYMILKPNGIVGVVQHRAPEKSTDEWANGSAGYLKQSAVIAMFNKAGFELVRSTELNANPKDLPTSNDVVWRLPPSLRGVKNDPDKRTANVAIGESDRMTLLFKKPAP